MTKEVTGPRFGQNARFWLTGKADQWKNENGKRIFGSNLVNVPDGMCYRLCVMCYRLCIVSYVL